MEFKEAWPFILGAYMGIWAILLVYVLVLQSKLSGVKRELESLSKVMERKVSS